MINEGDFLSINKINEIPQKRIYTEEEIIEKLSQGVDLDKDFAIYLIESSRKGVLLFFENFDKFKNLNHPEIALKIIGVEQGYLLVKNLEKFHGLDYQDIAYKLIEDDMGSHVARHLDKFPGLNHQDIASRLIRAGHGDSLIENLDKFQGLEFQDIVLRLIKRRRGGLIATHLDKFPDLDRQDIAVQLIEFRQCNIVSIHLDKFKLKPQKLYQAVKEKYPNFITEVETKIPKLAEQLNKSTELLLSVLDFKDNFSVLDKNITDNPFLLEALEDNPRYGSKLILKYQEFDETAKSNIKELFNNEAEILRKNPDLNTNSVEFRKMMQEKLMSFSSNKEIFSELENRGVDAKEWLNHDKQAYFTLDEQGDVKFSDQIKTPIIRIKETLNKYQDSIINTLSSYKIELQSSFVSSQGREDLGQKIEELKQRIEVEADEKKIQGMRRGLDSLEAKEKAIKPTSVWNKVQSDIFRLRSMTENIFKFHDACVQSEINIETTEDRKELIKEKDNLAKNKIQLQDNFQEFELFFESYGTKLQELLNPSLGRERSDSLLQEIKETIGEELNHYNVDKDTLKNIFNANDEDENKLKGSEMKISIASRSTTDLYLGNYCPCCICIESDYHGAGSPIADYVTDLGMQNIVVYDEKKNIPILTCWTFIGENDSDGEPIMVIDNIEADTKYTNNYPGELKEVIIKYISDYAKAINIKTIVQGPNNNDLEVFSLGKVDQKLGGKYNRLSSYFLEAENYGDDNDENE